MKHPFPSRSRKCRRPRSSLHPCGHRRRSLTRVVLLLGLTAVAGIGSWSLFTSSAERPDFPHQPQGAALELLLDRPHVNASLLLNCVGGYESQYPCAIQVDFPRRLRPGLRWALTVGDGFKLLGAGHSLDSRRVEGRPCYAKDRTLCQFAAPGRTIVGRVGPRHSGLGSLWDPGPQASFSGEIPAVGPAYRWLDLGAWIEAPLIDQANGFTAGVGPTIGAFDSRSAYRIRGLPGTWWPPRPASYHLGVLTPPGPGFLGHLRASPPVAHGHETSWDLDHRFQPHWLYTEPGHANDARAKTFISGVLLSIAVGLLLLLAEPILRPS